MKRKILFVVLVLALLVAACAPSQEQINQMVVIAQQTAQAQSAAPTQSVDQIVQATFQALTAQAVTPTPAEIAKNTGSISGKLTGGVAHVGAFQIGSDIFYKLELPTGQANYQIDNLPQGTYYVLSFTSAGGFAAPFPLAYSQYVLCGLTEKCTDHSLVPVTVTAGQVTSNIDILDNYGLPDRNPYMVKYFGYDQNGGTDVIPTFTPSVGQVGSISGKLSYPSSYIPEMTIVAFAAGGPTYYYMTTASGSGTYQLDNLPPGNYYVVAYTDPSTAAGYSQAVPCGLSVECGDHSLIAVTVTAGKVTYGVDPGDWYAPQNTFPAYPLP